MELRSPIEAVEQHKELRLPHKVTVPINPVYGGGNDNWVILVMSRYLVLVGIESVSRKHNLTVLIAPPLHGCPVIFMNKS